MSEKIERISDTRAEFINTVMSETRVTKTISDLKSDISIYTESLNSWQAKIDKAEAQIAEMITLGVKE